MLSFVIAVLIYGSFFLVLYAGLCPVRCRERKPKDVFLYSRTDKTNNSEPRRIENKKGKIKRSIILRERSIVLRGRSIVMREINNH
ncbi:hypothetical protein [Methanosarcina sp. DH2]|uniref:hypothetical protein n=1 Tax=Methanosarcina sp. DH2 TaxID=2605639 RepID=UPI001E2C6444|nr:hypothetical protein [Methanosarcina sp. DH2]